MNAGAEKQHVHDFWGKVACGEDLYLRDSNLAGYEEQARIRYELKPDICGLGRFADTKGKRILEIGVDLGADHQQFAQADGQLCGIDLTQRAVEHTCKRLAAFGLASNLAVGDAEALELPDDFFDIVYSWCVLHHSPNTLKSVAEVHRVLKPSGSARVMIYHKWSLVGFMLWVRVRCSVRIRTVLTCAACSNLPRDNESRARKVWLRRLLKRFFPTRGLFMLVEAKK